MTTPLLALDCPKCGAQLGKPNEGGAYLCAHCGERSIPEVRVEVQRVVGPQQHFNAVATQAEIDERKKQFEANLAKHQGARKASEQREASGTTKAVLVGLAVVVVIILLGTGMLLLAVLSRR